MPRSKSSKKWLDEHFADRFVQASQQNGYRSRAAYKLLALNEKDHFLKSGMNVVDLGAAPGGWTQVVSDLLKEQGNIFALDRLPMDHFPGVTVLEGDFTEQSVLDQLLDALAGEQIDVVLSDMAPNMSGQKCMDQIRSMHLVELALDFAVQTLKPGGVFVTKVFQGAGFEAWLQAVRSHFTMVKSRKPEASRARSAETYIVAQGFK